MLFSADDQCPNNLFCSVDLWEQKKIIEKKKVAFVYFVCLEGDDSVLKMSTSLTAMHTMAPFMAHIGFLSNYTGTVISSPWNTYCSSNKFNSQQKQKKKKYF